MTEHTEEDDEVDVSDFVDSAEAEGATPVELASAHGNELEDKAGSER